MPKRKLQHEDDVFVDDVPSSQSSSNDGTKSRHTSDVIDSDLDHEFVKPGPSTPVEKKTLSSNSITLDQGCKDIPDQEISVIPERVLRRADHVDATPPSNACEEYQDHEDYEGIPSAIEAVMPVSKDADLYNMSHQNRGTCMVFNHEIFEGRAGNREGSHVDVHRIEATFGALGFDVIVHNNLEYCDVINNVKKLSRENHGNNDCLCIFVLTHGQEDDYLLARDAAYTSDKIWKPFTADNCPSLAGKPKLFFFQACRGKKFDGGIEIIRRSSDDPCNDQADSIINSYTIPTLSDFLIAHSTAHGFYSWRNPLEGTWYVQSLCNVLDKFAGSTDLLKMLTMTSRRVATDFQSYDDMNSLMNAQKQIPTITSTLIRDLYLMPK